MIKKIMSLVLALVLIASMGAIAFSASAASQTIYFEVPSNWKNFRSIYCHIWPYGGDPLKTFQSKAEKCTLEADGRYSYDIAAKAGGISAGTTYCVLFATDAGVQTYDTLMGTACIGDTLYTNGTVFENPVDSSKSGLAGYWKNQSPSVYGPVMGITSIGNLVGTCLAPGETAEGLFSTFLTEKLDNARQYSGKQDQQIIDDMANSLGLSQDQVETLINKSGVSVDWSKAVSKAPEQSKPINPSVPSTGQETTIVVIALAMMVAAAGVVFFARKKVTK